MAITQTMTFSSTPPAIGDAPDLFESRAIGVWNELKNTTVPNLNTAFGQINSTEENVNTKEASAVASAITATAQAVIATEQAAIAVNAVSELPAGVINDATITLVDTWSSSKIASKIDFNYVSKSANHTTIANDFIYADTTTVAQVDTVTVTTVTNSLLYTVTINAVEYSYTSDIDATNDEIVAGLIAAINAGTEPVTASGTTTVILTADVAGTAFTTTVTAELSVATTTANKVGSFTVTLPATPLANDVVAILDNKSSFATNPLSVARNGNNIMGLAEDMVVDTNNISFELIYNGFEWRLK